MAKKKKVEPNEEDFDDGDLDDLEDEEIEIAVPTIAKKPLTEEKEDISLVKEVPSDEISDMEDLEELDYEFEEEEKPKYRYLNLTLNKGPNENDYELNVEGQSHGFLNVLVKHLLQIEGVNIAAYKVTRIEAPKIFIRLENGYNIKEILHQGIENLREDVTQVEKLFQKLL